MSRRIWKFLAVFVLFSFALSGCYYFSTMKEMKAAEQSFAELKAAGGATLVPYEYCSAEKFLEIAKIELTEPGYKPAGEFARRSTAASQAGLAEIQKKK
ncbi:MAG: hypothetical protein ABSG44_08080 [Thermodesulfobacteriota bacterium]|jgi:hypothetical protein